MGLSDKTVEVNYFRDQENLELKLIQEEQKRLLLYILDILEKAGINYIALGGTALGAVRHAGFIPWDDDVDIGVMRADYNTLLEILDKDTLPKGIYLQNYHKDASVPFSFTKIRSNSLKTKQNQPKYVHSEDVFIDIFPLDYYQKARFSFKESIIHILYQIKWSYYLKESIQLYSGYKKFGKILLYYVRKVTPKFFLHKIFDIFVSNVVTDYLICYESHGVSARYRTLITLNSFNKSKHIEFEHNQIRVPKDVEDYLENLYGKYLELPIITDRRPSHFKSIIVKKA